MGEYNFVLDMQCSGTPLIRINRTPLAPQMLHNKLLKSEQLVKYFFSSQERLD